MLIPGSAGAISGVLLASTGCSPWGTSASSTTPERILLRRTGGAYEFIHPLVLEHAAAVAPTSTRTRADDLAETGRSPLSIDEP
jgi:hypothetical protein